LYYQTTPNSRDHAAKQSTKRQKTHATPPPDNPGRNLTDAEIEEMKERTAGLGRGWWSGCEVDKAGRRYFLVAAPMSDVPNFGISGNAWGITVRNLNANKDIGARTTIIAAFALIRQAIAAFADLEVTRWQARHAAQTTTRFPRNP
jgi:hypothetical protein